MAPLKSSLEPPPPPHSGSDHVQMNNGMCLPPVRFGTIWFSRRVLNFSLEKFHSVAVKPAAPVHFGPPSRLRNKMEIWCRYADPHLDTSPQSWLHDQV